MKRIVLVAAACLVALAAFGKEIVGRVTRVSDGDTIWVSDRLGRHKVRLNGIDAPESNQAFGEESARMLASMIGDKEVCVVYDSTDRYGRILGTVYLGNENVNLAMLYNGCAWHYKKFDGTPAYSEAESLARSRKVGLWRDPNPVPPWLFRTSNLSNEVMQMPEVKKALKKLEDQQKDEDMRIWNDYVLSADYQIFKEQTRMNKALAQAIKNEYEQYSRKMKAAYKLLLLIGDGGTIPPVDIPYDKKLEMEKLWSTVVLTDDPKAHYCLGWRYEYGVGVDQDICKAEYFYRRAIVLSNRKCVDAIHALRRLGEWERKR